MHVFAYLAGAHAVDESSEGILAMSHRPFTL